MKRIKQFFASEKHCLRFLLIWLFTLSILYSLLSLLRHTHFQSSAFDLGIFDQTIWQYAHFLNPFNTIKERFVLGDHLTLVLPLLAPIFWIWDDVRILLISQAVFISFSAIPIYWLARLRKFSPFVSLGISFIYSAFYGIQSAVVFDFHPVILGVALLAWFIYFFEAKKKKLFWLTLVLMLAAQENMGIALAGVGLIYLFKKEHRKSGIYFIVGGIIISFLSVGLVSLMSSGGYEYWPSFDSLSPIHLFFNFFDKSDKLLTWQYSFGWFSFLPLFSPGTVLAAFLDLSQYFLPQERFGNLTSPFLHRRAILAPIMVLGLLDVLRFLGKRFNLAVIILIMILSSLFQQIYFKFPLGWLLNAGYWRNQPWIDDNNKMLTFVPKNAAVAATQTLVPHLSHRKEIYLIHAEINHKACNGCWWLNFAGKPQYLVVNFDLSQAPLELLKANIKLQDVTKAMEKKGKISLLRKIGSACIFKINY